MRIVVLDGRTLNPGDNPWDDLAALGELTVHDRTAQRETVARAGLGEIVLTNKTPLSAETLAQLPNLRLISVLATGYDVVDVEAARRRGVVVSNVPEYATDSVAQFTFALLLELCHHVGAHDRAVRAGQWTHSQDFCFWNHPLVELAGMRMGIIGFGRIGRRVGRLAHAFGMEVLACDVCDRERPEDPGVAYRCLDDLLAEADVVSLHAAHTEDTDKLLDAERLDLMKRTVIVVNTARGGLIDEDALIAKLCKDELAGAALDVWADEPTPKDNPLLALDNVVATPHVAAATLPADALFATVLPNILAALRGEDIECRVEADVQGDTGRNGDPCDEDDEETRLGPEGNGEGGLTEST